MKVKLPFYFILLMMTGVAWADSKVLWRGSGSLCGEHFHSTPEAARKACGYTRKGWKMEKRGEFTYEMGWYNEDGSFYKWTGAYVLGKTQSCELKDIPGKGTNGTHSIGFKSDKAPNMVRRCINNCEVEDRRVKKEGAAAGADYGGAVCTEHPVTGKPLGCSADYTRIQTGTVCIPKPESKDDTQYDNVTDQPADDNGNTGADGKGNAGDSTKDKPDNPGQPPKQDGRDDSKTNNGTNGSDGGGNQNRGQGGTGADSPRDSGSADEVDDKNKDKDKNKPGKGKGKGGGGGGKHGDKDKNDKDKTDDGKGGGKDGGKDGKDKADGSPNGTDNGTGAGGDKDGKGSGISGGDCKTGKAPSCKGET